MAGIRKHCLLVVDDEPDLVQSVQDLLRFDFRVLGATRAAEGLKIMEREKVHVVMTDQRMPEMTGVEFLKALREAYPELFAIPDLETRLALYSLEYDLAALHDCYLGRWGPAGLAHVLERIRGALAEAGRP